MNRYNNSLHSFNLIDKMRKLYFLLFLCLIPFLSGAQDLYDINKIREIKVRFAESNWDVILDSLKQAGNDDRLMGAVTIDGMVYDSVGVRYKGNSSYFNTRQQKSSKLPFNIKADYVRKKQRFKGDYKSLKLSNVFRDPSFLREAMAYEIAGKYMPAPRANFVKLYVNDKYIGLYNNTESIDKKFLKDKYAENKGVLLKCDPNWHAKPKKGCLKGEKASLMHQGDDPECYYGNYELKTKTGWKDLIELTKTLTEEPKKVHEILNVDQTLWMHAYNNVLVNLDSYSGKLCHNYYLYRDSFGVFQPMVWDMNMAFGGFRHDGTGTALSNEKLQQLSPFIHYKSPNRPLISQLLSNPLNRKVYIAHIRTILNENFKPGAFERRLNEVHRLIDFQVQQDNNKLYTHEGFKQNLKVTAKAGKSNIIGLLELMDARANYLREHPLLKKVPPTLSNVRHTKATDKVTIMANATNAETVFVMFRAKPHAPFKRFRLLDSGADGDQTAGDGIYSMELDGGVGAQYYVIGENEKSAALSPERAAFEFYKVE